MKAIRCLCLCSSLMLLLNACATTMRTDLYFGLNIPGGGKVSDKQWTQFNDSIVSPRFPEGYTEETVTGKWQDTKTHQTITEQTKVLTFIGRKSKTREENLDTVIQVYRRQYYQQAILRTDVKVRALFISR